MASENVIICSKLLANRGLKIAFAESATSGRLCSEFVQTMFAGDIVLGSVVCYDAKLKTALLDVPTEAIAEYSAESIQVSRYMVIGLQKLITADICVAVTGLTHSGGSENADKPVGTMFIHVLFGKKEISRREVLTGNPEQITLKTIDITADLITRELKMCI